MTSNNKKKNNAPDLEDKSLLGIVLKAASSKKCNKCSDETEVLFFLDDELLASSSFNSVRLFSHFTR